MRGQQGRRLDLGEFADRVGEYRDWLGLTDDAIAERFGITVEGLHKRFAAAGIERGRRYRDIEDAHVEAVLTKAEVRATYPRAS